MEGAARVDVEGLVVEFVAAFGQGLHLQDAGAVHQHVDPAQPGFHGVEHGAHFRRLRDVGADRDGAPACLPDLVGQGVGLGRAGGVVDANGKSVASQAAHNGGAYASGSAGNEGRALSRLGVHGLSVR
ncbi:hypothetical protein D3C87_1589210 [compost metagenome]